MLLRHCTYRARKRLDLEHTTRPDPEILKHIIILACVQKLFVILKDRETKIAKIQIIETKCKNKMYLRKALLKRPFPFRKFSAERKFCKM
jgi:hypothetical protein